MQSMSKNNKKSLTNIMKKYKSLMGLLILCIVVSIISPRFLTTSNITNVLNQVSVNSVLAIGMTFVILTGGIDLSVGSVLAISGAIAASIVKSTGNVFLAIVVAAVVGAFIGLINGILVAKGKMQAFIATLATMTIFRGATYVYTNGIPISRLGKAFGSIGNGDLFGIPIPVLITVVVLVIAWYMLTQTRFGRYIYAVGGNLDSARLSGINTDKINILAYVISGLTAAISGIIVTSRITSASANAGSGYELDAIAAIVIGGTSLAGGEGSIIGTLIGALIIGILNNALNLMDVTSFYQTIVKGIVILIAVLIDRRSK